VRKLGHATIFAGVVKELDADQAQLAEIDENLIRAELSPAERAAHVAARKAVYERLHPETKHGGDRKSESRSQNAYLKSFVADTAKKTGKHHATVARDVKRGKDILDVAALAGTSLDKGAELDALAKLSFSIALVTAAKYRLSRRPGGQQARSEKKRRKMGIDAMAMATTIGTLPEAEHSAQLRKAVIASTVGTAIEYGTIFFFTARRRDWSSASSTSRTRRRWRGRLRRSERILLALSDGQSARRSSAITAIALAARRRSSLRLCAWAWRPSPSLSYRPTPRLASGARFC
jgi:hypothetical protein